MAAFEWWAEVEYLAQFEPDKEMEQFAEGARYAHYNSADMVLRLTTLLDAVEYADALAEARAWADGLAVAKLAAAGRASGPVRFTIESQIARSQHWAMGTKEAAARLGVSPARLRQLEGEDPAFPAAAVDVAAGRVYRADEVETYARTRQPGRPGRPRKDA